MGTRSANLGKNLPFRSWIEIDESALRSNAAQAAEWARPARLLPVIKANAYGHGALLVARTLAPYAEAYAVANIAEAMELRLGGICQDLLLLGPCLPEERAFVLSEGCMPTVSSLAEALAFAALAEATKPAKLHFKIDTGMGRIGAWKEDALEALEALKQEPRILVSMISTHLSAADEDPHFTAQQLAWLKDKEPLLRKWFPGVRLHALNSAGLIRHPEAAFDLVRPGLMLYGVSPVPEARELLRPVMSWRTRVVQVREVPSGRRISYGGDFVTQRRSRVAVLAVGYADGYFRQIPSGGAQVLLRGQRCPVVGRITMDQIMVDATDMEERETLCEGETATLLGKDGGEQIRAEEMALWAGTIPWHVLTAIGPRVHTPWE